MSNPAAASIPLCHLRVLAASLALALAGCATPVLKPSLDCLTDSWQRRPPQTSPRWRGGKLKDPVLADLIRRQRSRTATSDRSRARARARAGEDGQPARGYSRTQRGRRAFDHKTNYDSVSQELRSGGGEYAGGADRRWRDLEVDLFVALRAAPRTAAARWPSKTARRRAPVGVERRCNQLLHAHRRVAPASKLCCDIRRAKNETLRLVTSRHRVGSGRRSTSNVPS